MYALCPNPQVIIERVGTPERRVDNFILKVLLFKRYKCLMFYLGCVHKEFLCQEHCQFIDIKQSSFSIFLSPCPLALLTPARDWGSASRKYPGQTQAWYTGQGLVHIKPSQISLCPQFPRHHVTRAVSPDPLVRSPGPSPGEAGATF